MEPLPTRVAMAVTGMQASRVNEASSRGYYQPPAVTEPARERSWNETDLIGLVMLRDLLRLDLKLPYAASRANQARRTVEMVPDSRFITINLHTDGHDSIWSDALGAPPDAAPITSAIRFDLEVIRTTLRAEIQRYRDQKPEELASASALRPFIRC